MNRNYLKSMAALSVVLLLGSGCSVVTHLKKDWPAPNYEEGIATIVKVEDLRGKSPKYLGLDLIGYVIVPVFFQPHVSNEPVASVTARAMLEKLDEVGMPATYRPDLTVASIKNLPEDQLVISVKIRKFHSEANVLHLIFGFVPGNTGVADVKFDIQVFRAPGGELIWEGTVLGKDRSKFDAEEWKREYYGGADPVLIQALHHERAVFGALNKALNKFISEANLSAAFSEIPKSPTFPRKIPTSQFV